MNQQVIFGVAALIVNCIGYIPYFRGILRGEVKPQRITWGIWSILASINFVNQVINGGGWSLLFFGSTTILVLAVFCLSFKYGVGGSAISDKIVLVLAFLLLILWIATGDTVKSTYIAITIDMIGALPTIFKAYKKPETEAYLQWIMAAAAGALSLVAVGANQAVVLYAYPVYIIVFDSIIVFSKYLGGRSVKRRS